MIQFLNIFGDVMRIATFQWRDESHHTRRCGEPADADRWSHPAARQPFRRARP